MAKPPSKPADRAAITDWGDVADWYDQLVGEAGSEFHRHVVLPGTLRLLAAKPGEQVLDVACGQGVLCRLLAKGGVKATGVDAAEELIETAEDYNATLPADAPVPKFRVADARELDHLPENFYDAAAAVLAIQNINPIQPVFQGVARCLKPSGKFVIVIMHPCFRGAKETEWGWDGTKVQYRRVDRYLLPRKSPIVTHPGKPAGGYTWTFHKPIESYVKALRNAGLLIDGLEEWTSHKSSQPGPRQAAENTARKEIPMFMGIRAVKVAGMSDDAS